MKNSWARKTVPLLSSQNVSSKKHFGTSCVTVFSPCQFMISLSPSYVNPIMLNILEKIFPLFNDKAVGMHGVPNVDKTPVARVIAMATSRYWVERLKSKYRPAYREFSEFDSCRGEAGRKAQTCLTAGLCLSNRCENSRVSVMLATPSLRRRDVTLRNFLKVSFASTSQTTWR